MGGLRYDLPDFAGVWRLKLPILVCRHLREGSQVSKTRPGAPIILSRRFSLRG
jgi:hypothetical protein